MILDTNAVSALLDGDPLIAEILAEQDLHHLPVNVIGEYRYGLARTRDRSRLGRIFELLIHHSLVLPIDLETTAHYAVLREELRRRGRPMPENDLWIAALARQYDLPVVTRDEHFDHVSNVRRISW